MDLVSLPLVGIVAIATAALAAFADRMPRFALGLGAAGVVTAAGTLPAAPLVAALLRGPATALLLTGSPPVRSTSDAGAVTGG